MHVGLMYKVFVCMKLHLAYVSMYSFMCLCIKAYNLGSKYSAPFHGTTGYLSDENVNK